MTTTYAKCSKGGRRGFSRYRMCWCGFQKSTEMEMLLSRRQSRLFPSFSVIIHGFCNVSLYRGAQRVACSCSLLLQPVANSQKAEGASLDTKVLVQHVEIKTCGECSCKKSPCCLLVQ